MTPLAYSIVKENWLPTKRRTFFDSLGLIPQMSDVHCFEVSDIFDLADDLGCRWHDQCIGKDGRYTHVSVDETFAFLPAPRTWIEWKDDNNGRVGVLLVEDETLALCVVAVSNDEYFGSVDELPLALKGNEEFGIRLSGRRLGRAEEISLIFRLYGFLALINSPKIIGRQQHLPHRALERQKLKGFAAGKFPLHSWTELKLQVSKPIEINDGELHEAHLTGRRALHFCRAHIRIRMGRLEYVSSHWRGDPAIGIKQTRYTVTP